MDSHTREAINTSYEPKVQIPIVVEKFMSVSLRNEIRELIMTDTLSEGLKSIMFDIYAKLPWGEDK